MSLKGTIIQSESHFMSHYFSVCIPRLVVSSLKALIGSEEHEECLEIVNLLFSESNQLYKCLNTQTAPDILSLVTQATSKLLENGKTL